jgi:hypothetical protein
MFLDLTPGYQIDSLLRHAVVRVDFPLQDLTLQSKMQQGVTSLRC